MSRRSDTPLKRSSLSAEVPISRAIRSQPSRPRSLPYENIRTREQYSQEEKGSASSFANSRNALHDSCDATFASTGQFEDCIVVDDSNIHKTAGYIAENMRSGGPLVVRSSSVASLNQAMKALALARDYLEKEDIDLTVEVQFSEDNNEYALAMLTVSLATGNWVRDEFKEASRAEQLYVSGNSHPPKVAGAIAKNVRAGRSQVCTAMGAKAIMQAIQSIAFADGYLEEDCRELCFAPEFGSSDDGMSFLSLYLFEAFRTCKVGPTSDVQKTAGYIAAGARQSSPPTILAGTSAAINQAVKAIALARSFLKDEGLDMAVQADFQDYYKNNETESCKFALATREDDAIQQAFDDPKSKEMWVSADSEPTKVAGAIAARVRGNQALHICSRGAQAVSRLMKAIFLARKYLKALELRFTPEFGSTTDGGSLVSCCILLDLD